jgi:hypothetical protein
MGQGEYFNKQAENTTDFNSISTVIWIANLLIMKILQLPKVQFPSQTAWITYND